MNESPREKQILEKLCEGERVKNTGPLSIESRILLRYIRGLTTKDLEGTLGKDKLFDLLTAVRPLFESATQLPNSPPSVSGVNQVTNKVSPPLAVVPTQEV